ncbi:MAG: O-acetylhomoserine aminocarboxypropyltransferase/cysteine synthase [Firmicutes bacterium]|nr:O-acetylhomoserine aminocarboxypropyltransferase/cysteine synthase [Bacillota bacterium]MBR0104970.1 O-acetylhomoserine aminocarboxypropyltransferase/cysteine synthase [Bacillota bacterium]MBR2594187.1 O-acetylhomoserine aminocarboxypropyltransferase/cysteine synthase [Bacillota bacterium]
MKQHIETLAVQAGYTPENGGPRVLPLYQSTTFKYDTCAELAEIFDLDANKYMYTRLANPTNDAFENKIAAMEGGVGAMATSSGMAAFLITVLNIMKTGDSLLAASTIYGGTFTLCSTTLKDLGIEVIFFDPDDTEENILALAKDNTKAIFGETIGNPAVNVLDFDKFASIAKKLDIPFIVDNTFATPVLCRPLELGADIVIHSTTKYIDGHASCVGGIIVDKGTFNWKNGKFPGFTEPDESYHGLVFSEKFGEFGFLMKARYQVMRNIGSTPSPFNSYLANLGAETMHLRMERHCENALKIAEYLKNHPMAEDVHYPGLPGDKYYELAQKYLPKGASGVITFGVKGGREASSTFIDNLKLAALVTHVADTRTCVLQPASTTHRQLSDEELISAGVSPQLIRLSVGIENYEDIIADFEQAFEAVKNAKK